MQKRHYEIVFLVHPDRGEQVPEMIKRYETIVKDSGGAIHRLENWGIRPLAYTIKKLNKANYVLMNIECDDKTLNNITENFRFNDDILRNLVIKKDEAITKPSPLIVPKVEKTEEIVAPNLNEERSE